MILGRVVGTIVATRKDPRLEGSKLLVVKPVSPTGKRNPAISSPSTRCRPDPARWCLLVSGSSARMAEGCKDKPVDASIVGIVDTVD